MAGVTETPTKGSADALAKVAIESPSKDGVADVGVATAAKATREPPKLNVDRTRFVGNLAVKSDADEPLLRENKHRFVLFPIQYHEVRATSTMLPPLH